MAFCSECGKNIIDGNKFCHHCGAPIVSVVNNTVRQQVYEGTVHKCPHCGAVVESFNTKCASCGYEFRDVVSSTTVKQFAKMIQDLELQRTEKSGKLKMMESFGIKYTDPVDEKKINLIRNYTVPNTKEDVLEFLILAVSNIDASLYSNNVSSTEKSISNAWMAKAEQVLGKAKITFGTEPEFVSVQNLYDEKMKAVKKSRLEINLLIVGLLLILVLFFVIVEVGWALDSKKWDEKENKLDASLNEKLIEVQDDILNEDYDAALLKVNELRYDEDIDSRKAEQWDEKREYLIEFIKEKKEEK